MGSWFDTEVYQRSKHTPWASVNLHSFISEMLYNEQTQKWGQPLDEPKRGEVVLRVVYRPDVASRQWFTLQWVGSDGDLAEVQAQRFDLLMWRAAQTEIKTQDKLARDRAKQTGEDLIGSKRMTPYDPAGEVEIVSVCYDHFFKTNIAAVRYLEDHPHGYAKDSIGYYPLDDLREVKP